MTVRYVRNIVLEGRFRVRLKRLISLLKISDSTAEINLLPSAEMMRLKKKFLGKKEKRIGLVDVLAFEEPSFFPNPDKKGNFLGEIYINRDIALKNLERAEFLLVHGLLHLLRYSHDKKNDTIKMQKLEKELIKKLDN